jgi:hypothetical protein
MDLEIDLNIENYDLDDLLKLFQLNYSFNISDLKLAKKIVLRLHPDKSGLDKKYFLFFCKAFRIINEIYKYRFKSFNPNTEYVAEYDKSNHLLIKDLLKKDNLEFNKWFNEAFEKVNIIEEERREGYGEWFKSDEDIDTRSTTKNMMNQKFNEKKEEVSSLMKREEIMNFNDNQNSLKSLDGGAPELYSCDVFSKLPYDDLKKAHTETVIPVSNSDYQKIKKYNSLEEYRNFRNNQNMNPPSKQESDNYFSNKNKKEDELNTNMAYKLSKQDEEMEKANNNWWSNLRLLL